MINPKLIFLFLFGIATLCWACKPTDTPDRTAEEIATAIEHGRYETAQELTNNLINRGREAGLDTMRVERLCILAVSVARLSEHSERTDEYTAFALKCLQQALLTNQEQTLNYIGEMNSDDYRYISFLNQLLKPISAREQGVVYSINDDGEDSTIDSIPNQHNHGE